MINNLKKRYYEISKKIAAPQQYVRFSETPSHDGSSHVEVDGQNFVYVVTERGSRFNEKRTTDPEELLFWMIKDLTFAMAGDFELQNRIETEDSRRQLFTKHLELLESINSKWATKQQGEYDQILAEHPFSD